jgi:hypothetical protein
MSPYFVISQKLGKNFFLSIYNESVFKLKLDDEQDNEDNLV